MGSKATPQARLVFKDAFDKLEHVVHAGHPVEARAFRCTTLQDVWTAAKKIEQELDARQCLRNMRRIDPFLAGLERYSKAVDVLCNGTDYLAWIWAPMKLILQLASDFTMAMEKLITAYGQIAEALPRFDRLSAAFQDNPDFQRVVAVVYADILDFHREAYEFFRKPGWKIFFKTLWAGFDRRFARILDSLARHSELVDKEASAIEISEAKEWRTKLLEDSVKREHDRLLIQFQTVLAWLEVKDFDQIEQEDELDRKSSLHHDHSTDWIQNNPKARSWMRRGKEELVLWLTGKPGAGKSVLSSMIIRFLQQDEQCVVLYYFCTYYSSSFNKSSHILRSLAAQLLRNHQDLAAYVYDEYMCRGCASSIPQLKKLIPTLLLRIPSARIVIDGLDEFEQKDQGQVLTDILPLARASDLGTVCKILVSSRDITPIAKHLARRAVISLNQERAAVEAAVQSDVQHSLGNIRQNLSIDVDVEIMAQLERDLIEKAEGMFLWVRLVLAALDNVHSVQELRDAVHELPKGLEKIYERVVNHMRQQMDPQDRDKAIRILEWIAVAQRPMKKLELLDGVTLHRRNSRLDEQTRLWEQVIDLCKPLVEGGPNGTIIFIHFTVEEYLLRVSNEPFIRPLDAHHDVAFACVAYLRTSLDLIDPRLHQDQKVLRVGRGFHALQLYAREHWITHLLTYIKLNSGLDGEASRTLREELVRLCEVHKQLESLLRRRAKSSPELPPPDGFEEDLRNVRDSDVKGTIRARLRLQTLLMDAQVTDGKDIAAYEMEHDATLFTQVYHSYQAVVRLLLDAKAVTGLDREQLANFKHNFGSSAFVCRFSGCPRATDGYPTEARRKEHEDLQHTAGIKCSETSCSWHRIGFRNSTALKRHMQKYHPSQRSLSRPSVLRRTHICGNGSRGCGQRFSVASELQDHKLLCTIGLTDGSSTRSTMNHDGLLDEDTLKAADAIYRALYGVIPPAARTLKQRIQASLIQTHQIDDFLSLNRQIPYAPTDVRQKIITLHQELQKCPPGTSGFEETLNGFMEATETAVRYLEDWLPRKLFRRKTTTLRVRQCLETLQQQQEFTLTLLNGIRSKAAQRDMRPKTSSQTVRATSEGEDLVAFDGQSDISTRLPQQPPSNPKDEHKLDVHYRVQEAFKLLDAVTNEIARLPHLTQLRKSEYHKQIFDIRFAIGEYLDTQDHELELQKLYKVTVDIMNSFEAWAIFEPFSQQVQRKHQWNIMQQQLQSQISQQQQLYETMRLSDAGLQHSPRRRSSQDALQMGKHLHARQSLDSQKLKAGGSDGLMGGTTSRYCYCNRVSAGTMIACDAQSCAREWFHLRCIGLTEAPGRNDVWYCDECKEKNSSAERPSELDVLDAPQGSDAGPSPPSATSALSPATRPLNRRLSSPDEHTVFRCIDVYHVYPHKPFASCRPCRTGMRYHTEYNAFAHLRRQHFGGDRPSGPGAAPDPPVELLRQFIMKVPIPAVLSQMTSTSIEEGGNKHLPVDDKPDVEKHENARLYTPVEEHLEPRPRSSASFSAPGLDASRAADTGASSVSPHSGPIFDRSPYLLNSPDYGWNGPELPENMSAANSIFDDADVT